MDEEMENYQFCSTCFSPTSCTAADVCAGENQRVAKLPKDFWYENRQPWAVNTRALAQHVNLKNKLTAQD